MGRKCPHCGATHPHDVLRCTATGLPIGGDQGRVGTTIGGRYHLVRLLGDGGMGAVYKAADQVLRRFVAIKLLHPATAQNPSAVERFVREARTAASIGHPNIIDILDFGKEGGRPFLVMEYLRGRSLSHAIANEGPFRVERACKIATHSLAGLAAAHDRGILHRDLKPANLMMIAQLGDRDFVKLCDFGFAALLTPKRSIDDAKSLTPARTLVGTPAYAAPERLRGDDRRDPRIDVYSIGVVLYEMLTGVRPFDAPSFQELARKVRNEPPPPLRAIRSEIPGGLERVVLKSLAKDREDRWANAEEFATALVPFGGRVIPAVVDDHPSDSFTMDLIRIKARETQRQKAVKLEDAEALLRSTSRKAPAPKKRQRNEPFGGGTERMEARDVPEIDISVEELQSEAVHDELRSTDSRDVPPAPAPGWSPPSAPTRVPAVRRRSTTERSPPPDFTPPHLEVPPARAPVAPEPAHEFDRDRAFAGEAVVAMLRFVARRFGERALRDLLDGLEEPTRGIFLNGVAPDDWVPYDAVNAFMQSVDAHLGRDDLHLVVQCGRAAAEGAFERLRDVQPPAPPPELLLAEMPSVMEEIVRGVVYRVRRVGRGYGRLEMDEQGESSLAGCVASLGFIDRALDRFGAAEVEVNLTSCVALGDEVSVFEISWLA